MTRSRKTFRLLAAVLATTLAVLPGTALAERAERACVGAFVSGQAAPGGVGGVVSEEAKTLHPFGQFFSQFASTCEFPAG